MKTSDRRILTTHAGSLPRTDTLARMLIERDHGRPVPEGELRREIEVATDWVVARQLESGVDIGSDGEEARVGFQTYASVVAEDVVWAKLQVLAEGARIVSRRLKRAKVAKTRPGKPRRRR